MELKKIREMSESGTECGIDKNEERSFQPQIPARYGAA